MLTATSATTRALPALDLNHADDEFDGFVARTHGTFSKASAHKSEHELNRLG
jgi:hypothetical protein